MNECECLVYNAGKNRSTTKNYYGTCLVKSVSKRDINHTSSFRNKSEKYRAFKLHTRIEKKWQELHNGLINCYESTSIHVWNVCVKNYWFIELIQQVY